MSDLSPAAQELDEDLRLLMHDAFFPTEAVKERVWGCDSGVGRTVEESRDRYRVPIVEAFQASGAPTLAEFPERVRFLADAYYTLLHERDMAKAEANRYHEELTALRESEHNAKMEVIALRGELRQVTEARDVARGLINNLRAEVATVRGHHAELTAAHAKAVAALSTGSLAELRASRDSLSGRVSDLTVENAGLRRSVRRLCRILGKAMAGDL